MIACLHAGMEQIVKDGQFVEQAQGCKIRRRCQIIGSFWEKIRGMKSKRVAYKEDTPWRLGGFLLHCQESILPRQGLDRKWEGDTQLQ
jgi:hypothetical protein